MYARLHHAKLVIVEGGEKGERERRARGWNQDIKLRHLCRNKKLADPLNTLPGPALKPHAPNVGGSRN